jgi:hypothetical protein
MATSTMNPTPSYSSEKSPLLLDKPTHTTQLPTVTHGHYRRRKQRNRDITLAMGLLLAVKALIVIFALVFCSTQGLKVLAPASGTKHGGLLCAQPNPPAQPSNWSTLYDDPKFAMESAQRLSGAVQVPTQ